MAKVRKGIHLTISSLSETVCISRLSNSSYCQACILKELRSPLLKRCVYLACRMARIVKYVYGKNSVTTEEQAFIQLHINEVVAQETYVHP
jgi:hypothetical protein